MAVYVCVCASGTFSRFHLSCGVKKTEPDEIQRNFIHMRFSAKDYEYVNEYINM